MRQPTARQRASVLSQDVRRRQTLSTTEHKISSMDEQVVVREETSASYV